MLLQNSKKVNKEMSKLAIMNCSICAAMDEIRVCTKSKICLHEKGRRGISKPMSRRSESY